MAYCMCFVRHIEGILYHLQNPAAPRYVDVVEVNNTRTIERARANRLVQVKVGNNERIVYSTSKYQYQYQWSKYQYLACKYKYKYQY